MSKKIDDVKGKHYGLLGISPFQYSFANGLDCYQHTAIKYITRHRDKGGVADLNKAINTLELYKEELGVVETNNTCSNDIAEVEISAEVQAMQHLIEQVKGIKKNRGNDIDLVFTLGRGGAWAAAQIAYALDAKLMCVDNLDIFEDVGWSLDERTLFVDDICDTGHTLYEIRAEYPGMLAAVLFNRSADYVKGKKAAQPDYVGLTLHHDKYINFGISQMFDPENKNKNSEDIINV
jgi:hypoxanthine phosphoribosyltransferase